MNAFLEKIDELRKTRNVSEKELFEPAFDIFDGKALVWYRSVRKELLPNISDKTS